MGRSQHCIISFSASPRLFAIVRVCSTDAWGGIQASRTCLAPPNTGEKLLLADQVECVEQRAERSPGRQFRPQRYEPIASDVPHPEVQVGLLNVRVADEVVQIRVQYLRARDLLGKAQLFPF